MVGAVTDCASVDGVLGLSSVDFDSIVATIDWGGTIVVEWVNFGRLPAGYSLISFTAPVSASTAGAPLEDIPLVPG